MSSIDLNFIWYKADGEKKNRARKRKWIYCVFNDQQILVSSSLASINDYVFHTHEKEKIPRHALHKRKREKKKHTYIYIPPQTRIGKWVVLRKRKRWSKKMSISLTWWRKSIWIEESERESVCERQDKETLLPFYSNQFE